MPSNHVLWREVVPTLAAHARTIAVDLLGYGAYDPPSGKAVAIVAQAGYIAGLLQGLGVKRALVVGHDIGGGVTQLLAVPRRIPATELTLIGHASHFSPVDAPHEVASALLRLLARPATTL